MALDLSAASIIRAGSGLLFLLLGALLLARRGASSGARSLGALCVFFGLPLVVVNLAASDPDLAPIALILSSACYVGGAIAAVAIVRTLPRVEPSERIALIAAGILALVVMLATAAMVPQAIALTQGGSDSLFASGTPVRVLAATFYSGIPASVALMVIPILSAWRYAKPGPGDTDRTRALTLVSLCFLVISAAGSAGDSLAPPGHSIASIAPADAWLSMALAVLACVSWLVAHARHPSRLALANALVPLAVALVALVLYGEIGYARASATGFLGIARTLAWLALVALVVRHEAIGLRVPGLREKRSAIAMGALALLFIVAQIAQSFFAAQYGLILGGIVAGAFLFAAQPFQRAMERMTSSEPSRPTASLVDANERAFRDAVRLAFRDRRFDRAEEVTLANLADRLGLSARRATEIRHEVEGERGLS